MDNTTDTLEIKIAEARNTLSKESRESIDNVNWKLTILGMNQKYTQEQLDSLEIETELLLCGILNPDDYPMELENRMHITKEDVGVLINEMDKLVFKKIQTELERIISIKNKLPQPKVEVIKNNLDPRFAVLPKETQEAISKSDYQKSIYSIGTKYKLNVEQMGILEEITIKTMLGTVPTIKYEEALTSKITIPKEDMNNLVKDVNELVFKKIRDLEMNGKNENITTTKEEVPLPPYGGTVKNYELGIKNEGILNSVVQTPKIPEVPKIVEQVKTPEVKIPNMMEEKLKGVTVSGNTVSDYSTPKINTPTSTETPASTPKSFDPYREAI